jgi:hypothetical protein
MHHRRSHSESEVNKVSKDNVPCEDEESVVSDESSSIHTVDLYTGWRLPDFSISVSIPGWFILLVTLLLFRGPSSPPSYVV